MAFDGNHDGVQLLKCFCDSTRHYRFVLASERFAVSAFKMFDGDAKEVAQ